MRRLALRALILAAALTTLAVPVFRVSGTPGSSVIPTASACSVPGCVFTSTVTGALNSFFSPITITVSSVTISEFQLHGEQTTGVSLPGTLTLSVNDLRGNNEGFVVSVSSGGFSCTVPNFCTGTAIAASDLSVSSTPTASLASCIGMCAPITGLASAVGKTLDMPVAVAAQCPAELIGLGLFNISVPFAARLSASEAEAFTFFPASYAGTFSLSVDESAATVSSVAPTCAPPPPAPTATVVPTTTVTRTATVVPTATITPTATVMPTAHMVAMVAGMRFSPATLTIPRGSTVTWMNQDTVHHTTTSNPGDPESWDSGDMAPGATFSHTFMTPGTYAYHCTYHQALGMVGTVIVQ